MNTLFVLFDSPAALSEADGAMLAAFLPLLPGLHEGSILTPERQDEQNPFATDGCGPALVLQLGFEVLSDLQSCLRESGALAPLARPDSIPSLAGASVRHQVMTARSFPVPNAGKPPDGALTFFVTYPGRTADLEAWLKHYDANHPPIMCRFPGVRQVETYRPITWESELPWSRDTAMQRNKVVFDDLAALVAALTSPVMAEMRADAATFPPFSPRATHFPMRTRAVRWR